MMKPTDALEWINFRIPFGRWQSFETNDLWIVPPFIRHDHQDILSARWTKKIPIIQRHSPAELVAEIITHHLQDILLSHRDEDEPQWKLIDFGSGTAGPIPVIEAFINRQRLKQGKTPIPFLLSDTTPNLDAWIPLAAKSDDLSFVPQSVDAANPPFSVLSTSTRGDKDAAAKAGYELDGAKVCRTYCGVFNRFDDEMATRVLKSTMETSDAFVIIEMQERRVLSLVLVLLELWVVFCLSVFWFWGDRMHLFFTYAVPMLPVMQVLDGVVTCLRTRSFEETLGLIPGDIDRMGKEGAVELCDWRLERSRILHTWPLGYMNVITGMSLSREPG